MWLKKIDISRWMESQPLKGEVQFDGETGSIGFILSPEEVIELVQFLGPLLAKHTQNASKRMEVEAAKSLQMAIANQPKVISA